MCDIFISSLKQPMVLQAAKYFITLPIFNVLSFYYKLHVVDAVFIRTQTSLGIGQTV